MTAPATVRCPNCGCDSPTDDSLTDIECDDDECPIQTFDGTQLVNPDPGRYTPDTEVYEQKDWLYEQYWGQFKTASEVAEAGGTNHTQILNQLEKHGIPRRVNGFSRDNAVSAFRGFYDVGPAQSDGVSNQQFNADYESDYSGEFTYTHWKGVGD